MSFTKNCTVLWAMSPCNLQRLAVFCGLCRHATYKELHCFVSYVAMSFTKTCTVLWDIRNATYKDLHCFVSYVAMSFTKTCTVLWAMSPCNLQRLVLFCELCRHVIYKDLHCFVSYVAINLQRLALFLSYVAMSFTKTCTLLWAMPPCNLQRLTQFCGLCRHATYKDLHCFMSYVATWFTWRHI